MAKRIAIAAVCLVVIAVCVGYILRPSSPRPKVRPADYRRPWVCESCGHTFLELPAAGARRCPQCGKRAAVQSVVYVCGQCGHEFEAYRLKDYYGTEADTDETGQPVMPVAYYRKAGGRWTPELAELGAVSCPKCSNADPATLTRKPYGPKAGR